MGVQTASGKRTIHEMHYYACNAEDGEVVGVSETHQQKLNLPRSRKILRHTLSHP